MPTSALQHPQVDPTPIFEHFRGSYGTELLVAAYAEFDLFRRLAERPRSRAELSTDLALAERPTQVLVTALRAMHLLSEDEGRLAPTPLSVEHLTGGYFDVGDYLRLAADSPGVREMVTRLRTNRPAGAESAEQGAAFVFREGLESAMEREASARFFTLALAGRAKNCAPALADQVPLGAARCVLDVAGGTGIYSIALLQRHPRLRAIVFDRPEVLKVADEMAREYGVAERMQLVAGDMFRDPWPTGGDVVLLSNVLHDWDVPQCRELVERSAATLPPGGQLLIHDVFLSDSLDGPLPVALYSAALFTVTEGRAYSRAEYAAWMHAAGLEPASAIRPTLVHCGVVSGTKPAGR